MKVVSRCWPKVGRYKSNLKERVDPKICKTQHNIFTPQSTHSLSNRNKDKIEVGSLENGEITKFEF